jgi:hypothetical protein
MKRLWTVGMITAVWMGAAAAETGTLPQHREWMRKFTSEGSTTLRTAVDAHILTSERRSDCDVDPRFMASPAGRWQQGRCG